MEVSRLSFPPSPSPQNPRVNFSLNLGLGEEPEPSPAPSKIFVPEQHIYIDKPGF